MADGIPAKLYHYTNVDALALILKNRTIRFTPLDRLDDPQEKAASDVDGLGRFCFASSWTEVSKEYLPMWAMYTNMNTGVRICLSADPFQSYTNPADEIEKASGMPCSDVSNGNPFRTRVQIADMFTKKYFVHPFGSDTNFLYKVEYTDDEGELRPSVFSEDGDGMLIEFDKFGKYKSSYWSFQEEWRYLLNIYPFDLRNVQKYKEQVVTLFNSMRLGLPIKTMPYFDLRIADDAFAMMEITLSPQMSDGYKLITESLVREFNPEARISDSIIRCI